MGFKSITTRQIKEEGFPALDYHIHANYADANLRIVDIFSTARNRGLSQIAITEHIWKDAWWVNEYIEQIKKHNLEDINYALIGAEARIIDIGGELNISDEEINKFDLIIGVVHRYPITLDPALYQEQLSIKEAVEIEEKALIAMIKKRKAHVVGHIGRALEKFYCASFPSDAIKRILKYAKEYEVAVEISAGSKNSLDIFRECLSLDCLMSFGTDSHLLDDIGIYDVAKLQEVFNSVVGKKIIFA